MTAPAAAQECRYVVLHHVGYGEPHFDLMIDLNGTGPLATWRCPAWPPGDRDVLVPIPDHRRVYLAYEGPISGGRGRVERVAQGSCWITVVDCKTLNARIGVREFSLTKTSG